MGAESSEIQVDYALEADLVFQDIEKRDPGTAKSMRTYKPILDRSGMAGIANELARREFNLEATRDYILGQVDRLNPSTTNVRKYLDYELALLERYDKPKSEREKNLTPREIGRLESEGSKARTEKVKEVIMAWKNGNYHPVIDFFKQKQMKALEQVAVGFNIFDSDDFRPERESLEGEKVDITRQEMRTAPHWTLAIDLIGDAKDYMLMRHLSHEVEAKSKPGPILPQENVAPPAKP